MFIARILAQFGRADAIEDGTGYGQFRPSELRQNRVRDDL